jgi:Rps23 Pro-64 3,4-dihydroxylase Tpa1-like proline 4-hydroxylase
MRCLDLARLQAAAPALRRELESARPFPHLVLDDFLRPSIAEQVASEYDLPSLDWRHYYHVNERKLAVEDRSQMGPASRLVIDELQSEPFLETLRAITGIERLIADPDLDGGGLQQTRRGGFVNVHTDFLSHTTRTTWSRQINLLLYLNKHWPESYKGWLELWDDGVRECVRHILPIFNRCVIFRTRPRSFHGVPAGVACPDDETRKSIALYYFRDEGQVCPLRPTFYAPLPSDPLAKRLLIRADRWLLYGYSALKRYTPINNDVATRVLKYLGGGKAARSR